jgi:hypothetical protein
VSEKHKDRGGREHREIHDAMNEIEAVFERWSAGAKPAEDIDDVGAAIAALRTRLRSHFEYEEQEGILAPREGLDPEDSQLVKELLAQHRTLEERLSKNVEEVGGADGIRSRAPATVVREMRSLFRDIRRHEAREGVLERRPPWRTRTDPEG